MVYVLTIDHKHGMDVWAFSSRDKLDAKLIAYVNEWFFDEIGEPRPENDGDAILEYFDRADEFYSTHEIDIDS